MGSMRALNPSYVLPRGRIFLTCLVALASCSFSAEAGDTDAKKNAVEKHTIVHQFYGTFPAPHFSGDKQEAFETLVQSHCQRSTRVETSGIAVGAVLLDWIAGRAVSAANKKLDRYIKEHTATYKTDPAYSDIGAGDLWGTPREGLTKPLESCVVVRRIHCVKGATQADGWKGCVAHMQFAAKMRHEDQNLRVLPVALNINGLEARHSKGKAVIGINFEIQAISHSNHGGRRWTSGDVPLVAEEFDAGKSNPKKQEWGDTEVLIDYSPNELLWGNAAVLPMPPRMRPPNTPLNPTVGTFKVTVSEVGRPNVFSKRLAGLLSAKEDDLAGALGSALKKAADIEDQ